MRGNKGIIIRLICVASITAFFLINDVLCNYWAELELINSYDSTPYNQNAIVFVLDRQDSGVVDLSEIRQNTILRDCALLKYNYGTYKMNEVIYCADGVVEIDEGIKHFDFGSMENVAAVGCDAGYNVGEAVCRDGKEYIIKGILAEHISSAINTGVFYCSGRLSEVPVRCAYVLASKNKKAVVKAYTKLEELIEEQHAEIKIIETERAAFRDYVSYTGMLALLFAVLALFYILLIYVFRYSWLKIRTPEIKVLEMLGDVHIEFKIRAEYFALWTVGILLSLIIFAFIYAHNCYDFAVIAISNSYICVIAAMSGINIGKPKSQKTKRREGWFCK